MFTFIPANDPRTRFEVTIPVNGEEYLFSVPRMDFISEDVFRDYMRWEKENGEEKLIKKGVRPAAAYFDKLIEMLGIDHYKDFQEHLVYGEKRQLWEEWNRLSATNLGESEASSNS